jgi:hypothetical protein
VIALVTGLTALQGGSLMVIVIAEAVNERAGLIAVSTASLAIALTTAAVPVLYARVAARAADARSTSLLLGLAPGMISFQSMGRAPSSQATALENAPILFHWFAGLFLGTMAVAWVVKGATEHWRLRALERRLAALRSTAA